MHITSAFEHVETERLLLRRPHADDLAAVVSTHADPETNRFNPRGAWSPEQCHLLLNTWLEHWQSRGFGYWAVALRTNALAVVGFGGVILKKVAEEDCLNLYFRLSPSCWGSGYATELSRAALHLAFQDLKHDRVRALVRISNAPSRRTIERLGMVAVGQYMDSPNHEGSLVYEASRPLRENAT